MHSLDRKLKEMIESLTGPHVGHGPDNPLTQGIINAMQRHLHGSLSLGMNGPIQVHVLSEPADLELEKAVRETAQGFGPVHLFTEMGPTSENQSSAHICIFNTALEHQANPHRLLKVAYEKLDPNGLLMVINHDHRSTFADDLSRRADDLHFTFKALDDFTRKNADKERTVHALTESTLTDELNLTPQQLVQQFERNYTAQTLVSDTLEARTFSNAKASAERINDSELTHQSKLNAALRQAGFVNVGQARLARHDSPRQTTRFWITGCFKSRNAARKFGFRPE